MSKLKTKKGIQIDVDDLEIMEVNGIVGFFIDCRVDKSTIPNDYFLYELRHGDDDSIPCTIEESVLVNFYGTFITKTNIELINGRVDIPTEDDYGFIDDDDMELILEKDFS